MINYENDLILVRPYLPTIENKIFLNETRINLIYNLEYFHPDGRYETFNYNDSIKQFINVVAAVREYNDNLDSSLVNSTLFEAELC